MGRPWFARSGTLVIVNVSRTEAAAMRSLSASTVATGIS